MGGRMSLSIALQSILKKLPPGWAMGQRDGVIAATLSAPAGEIALIEEQAEALMRETDPRTASIRIDEFERCLGPDPCGRDLAALTLPQRQQLAHQRWTARGGASIPYFIDLALKLGVDIWIEEFWPSVAGRMKAGQPLRPQGCQFVWRVNIPAGLTTVVQFRAGASKAGHSLGRFDLSSIECEFRRIAPAHTHVIFSYGVV